LPKNVGGLCHSGTHIEIVFVPKTRAIMVLLWFGVGDNWQKKSKLREKKRKFIAAPTGYTTTVTRTRQPATTRIFGLKIGKFQLPIHKTGFLPGRQPAERKMTSWHVWKKAVYEGVVNFSK
jgi:hypothetical protein